MSALLTTGVIDADPGGFVRAHGTVVAIYDHRTQDSGNVSWLVDVGDRLVFVKTAGLLGAQPEGAPVPYLDHAGRVGLLRDAIDLAGSCTHPALARLLHVVESPTGPVLVYAAAPGELVHVPSEQRGNARSAYQRFAHLPAGLLLGVLDQLLDLHDELATAGWVAADLYDGCLVVDLATGSLTVIDLDTYRRGPGRNERGRMFGSTRFMAPEELELGAVIDQRTTVFTLGRLVSHFGTRLTERTEEFCGSPAVARVVQRATRPERADRFASVGAFVREWRAARTA